MVQLKYIMRLRRESKGKAMQTWDLVNYIFRDVWGRGNHGLQASSLGTFEDASHPPSSQLQPGR